MTFSTLNNQNFDSFTRMQINSFALLNTPETTFTATAGDDSFIGTTGNDTVDYSATNKGVVVSLDYKISQNTQGSGNDTLLDIENLTGTNYNDLLVGNAKDNLIKGLTGDDTLVSGQGDDTLDGGDGIDTVDYVGNDKAVIVDLNYTVVQNTQGAGNDLLLNIESLGGSHYDDLLVGSLGAGNKYIYGNGGNDIIVSGGQGLTTVLAGIGNDTIVSLDGVSNIDGGVGTDWVDYSHLTTGVVADLSGATKTTVNDIRKNSDTLTNIENLAGSNYDDVLKGNDGNNNINGNDGNDYIDGRRGNDIINAGHGDDIIVGSEGNHMIDGGEGNDTLDYSYIDGLSADYGKQLTVNLSNVNAQQINNKTQETIINVENVKGSGLNDNIRGNRSDNNIQGLNGNDVLNGEAGNDNLNGGTGHDTLDGGSGHDIINGAEGIDWVAYSSATSGVIVNLNNQQAQNTLGAGMDTIINIENLSGSDYNDTLIGDSGNNILNGLQGDDTLDGGAGIDEVYYINANQGVVVNLGNTNAQNTVGAGVDTLSNIENIQGSAFDDILIGDNGNNRLTGNEGNDSLQGMAGDDTFVGGLGNDVIDGGDGFDTVDYSNLQSNITVDLSQSTGSVQNTIKDTYSSIESIIGTSLSDTLIGNAANNTFYGGKGNDRLIGGEGNDVLYGGEASDTFDGGVGDDIMDGGEIGYANSIYNFIYIPILDGNTVTYANASNAVTVDLHISGSQNTIGAGNDTLININALVGSNYNDTLIGNDGVNFLEGGLGNDILTGGAGKDDFLMYSPLGANNIDTITDFTPSEDLIKLSGSIFQNVYNGYQRSIYQGIRPESFVANSTGTAMDSDDRLVYNTTTGELSYDADGHGSGTGIVFAILGVGTHPLISYRDFTMDSSIY